MKVLAIETSCDETAVAVVEKKESEELVSVLSSALASSEEMHVQTGGIVPEIAAREQVRSMMPVLEEALRLSKETKSFKSVQGDKSELSSLLGSSIRDDIDAIAVTVGPGLIGSLLVGVETAKTLALVWDKPLIPVNHVLAHLYANWVNKDGEGVGDKVKGPEFPALGMVVSGGHSDIFWIKNHRMITWLGGTVDDAAGECFDKTARVLGLPYPGGPSVAAAAKVFEAGDQIKDCGLRLPRPMLNDDGLMMSFSGLKTAVVNEVRKVQDVNEVREVMAYEIQEAITDVLVGKLVLAVKRHQPKSVVVAGGVSANSRLREKLSVISDQLSVRLFIPPLSLCTDNAVMVGAYATLSGKEEESEKVKADPGLDWDNNN